MLSYEDGTKSRKYDTNHVTILTWDLAWIWSTPHDARHEKTDLKVFVLVIPKEGWARVTAPILLLV